MDTLVVIRVD